MELKELSRLAVRIFSLVLALKVLAEMPWIYSNYLAKGQESSAFLISATIFPVVLPLLFSLLLWKFSGTVSDKLTGRVSRVVFPELSFEKAFGFCIALLGVYVCVFAFVDLTFQIFTIIEQLGGNPGMVQDPTTYPGLASTLVEMFIGIFMVFGRAGISNFLVKQEGVFETFITVILCGAVNRAASLYVCLPRMPFVIWSSKTPKYKRQLS